MNSKDNVISNVFRNIIIISGLETGKCPFGGGQAVYRDSDVLFSLLISSVVAGKRFKLVLRGVDKVLDF